MSVLKVGSIQPNSGVKVNITGSTLLVTTASGHFSGSYEGDGSRLSGVAGFPFTGSGTVSVSVASSELITSSGVTSLVLSASGGCSAVSVCPDLTGSTTITSDMGFSAQ